MKRSILCAGLILLLGMASGWLSGSGHINPWFATLAKPWFMPPGWVFPVVWTTLYILMGLALAHILGMRSPLRSRAIGLFLAQLSLNLSWSPTFFVLHEVRVALGIMILLDMAAVATVIVFARIALRPAVLLMPYLVWLGIATALNASILRLNG